MTKLNRVLVVDPPGGWMYGFPKKMPSDGTTYEELLRASGYPEKDIELALKHSRYWESNEL